VEFLNYLRNCYHFKRSLVPTYIYYFTIKLLFLAKHLPYMKYVSYIEVVKIYKCYFNIVG